MICENLKRQNTVNCKHLMYHANDITLFKLHFSYDTFVFNVALKIRIPKLFLLLSLDTKDLTIKTTYNSW